MPPWEAAQIALGLSIPFLAVAHVMTTRGLSAFYGVDPTYAIELRLLWPARALMQSLFLLVVCAARHGRPAPLAADQAVVSGVEPPSAHSRRAGSHAGSDGLDRGRTPGRLDALRGAATLPTSAYRKGVPDRPRRSRDLGRGRSCRGCAPDEAFGRLALERTDHRL